MMVVVGRPVACPGAFDCIYKDMLEVFVSPATIIGFFAGVILLFLVWILTSKKEFKTQLRLEALTALSMLLAVGVGMAFYSPIKQYDNLKEQFGDLQVSEERRRFELERERNQRLAVEGRIRELEYRLDAIKESVQKVQDKNDEILRNLPKGKAR